MRKPIKRFALVLIGVLVVVLSMSLLARKVYAPGLKLRSAWLAFFGRGGWERALRDAAHDGETVAEITGKLGTPYHKVDKEHGVLLLYAYPKNEPAPSADGAVWHWGVAFQASR